MHAGTAGMAQKGSTRETTPTLELDGGSSWHLPSQATDAALAGPSPLDLASSTDAVMDTAVTEQNLSQPAGQQMPTIREAERADDLLIPPLNFGRVCRGVYRSGFPGKKNFTFLKKLKLHTVLNLSEHEYPKESIDFLSENQIEWTHMPIVVNCEPMQSTDEALLCNVLVHVLRATADRLAVADPSLLTCVVASCSCTTTTASCLWHNVCSAQGLTRDDTNGRPLLIHCTKGTHRTGCVVGCLRKLEEWSLTSIFDEYQRYAGNKVAIFVRARLG